MSTGSGLMPAGTAPSRAAKMGVLPAGMPAPAYMPLPSEPTIDFGWNGSGAPRPLLSCAHAGTGQDRNNARSIETGQVAHRRLHDIFVPLRFPLLYPATAGGMRHEYVFHNASRGSARQLDCPASAAEPGGSVKGSR